MSDKFVGMYVLFDAPISEEYSHDLVKYISAFKGVRSIKLTEDSYERAYALSHERRQNIIDAMYREVYK